LAKFVFNHPTSRIAHQLLLEAKAVAAGDGQRFTEADIEQTMVAARNLKHHSTSKKRTTEAAWMYGYMIAVAKKSGLKVPVAQKVFDAITLAETGGTPDLSGLCDSAEETKLEPSLVSEAVRHILSNPTSLITPSKCHLSQEKLLRSKL
jgi:hypothetical protein